jgi:membrane fusion protein, heavy metal efflux system
VWVVADVDDRALADLHVGDDVEITVLAYPERSFHAALEYVPPTVDPALRTVRVRTSLANAGHELKPEMVATVAIEGAARRALAVPAGAVTTLQEASVVFVAAELRPDGRRAFHRRVVTTGARIGGQVVIADGLAPGEQVLVEGAAGGAAPADAVRISAQQLADTGITTVAAAAAEVDDAIALGGRLAFDDSRSSHVYSPVNGRVVQVLAQPGQHVARGAPLALLSSPDVAGYLADLAKAAADVTQAEHEAQRQRELTDAGVGARRDLEAADSVLAKARAERDRARQLAELVRPADLDTVSQGFVLRSPIAGEVVARKATPGLEVQGQYAGGGSSSNVVELFTIGALDPLWLVADAYELDLPRIALGARATVEVAAYPGRPATGEVAWIAPVLDPTSHTAKLRCAVANPDHRLRPEMYAAVTVAAAPARALTVPRAAVVRVDGDSYVFVAGAPASDGSVAFTRRRVTAALDANPTVVPITSGLRVDERVAAHHALLLQGMVAR